MTNLERQKLIEEIAALKKPWYSRIDAWVAIVAIVSSFAGLAFQFSLHDRNLLLAKAEKSLALEEKIKAENEKYLIIRERIVLAERLESFQRDLKALVDEHNKLISTTVPDAKQVKALVEANYRFLEAIREKQTQIAQMAIPSDREVRYLSWLDQFLSSIISLALTLLGLYVVYRFLLHKHPELIQLAKDSFRANAKKDGHNES